MKSPRQESLRLAPTPDKPDTFVPRFRVSPRCCPRMARCDIAVDEPNKLCSLSGCRRRCNRRCSFPGAIAFRVLCDCVIHEPLARAGRGTWQSYPVPHRSPRHSRDPPCSTSRNVCTRMPTHPRTKAVHRSSQAHSRLTGRLSFV